MVLHVKASRENYGERMFFSVCLVAMEKESLVVLIVKVKRGFTLCGSQKISFLHLSCERGYEMRRVAFVQYIEMKAPRNTVEDNLNGKYAR